MTIIVTLTSSTGQLSTILNELQQRGYASDTQTAQIVLLNSIQRRVCGMRRWPWLEAQSAAIPTVIGTSYYALSTIADFQHIDAVRAQRGTEYYNLDYMRTQEFREWEHVYRDNGAPVLWTRQREGISIWPPPNAVYTLVVDYVKRPTDLAADTDVPLVPYNYHDILVWGAIQELAFRERDWDAVNVAEGHVNTRIAEMMREYGVTQRQTSQEVVRTQYTSDPVSRLLN